MSEAHIYPPQTQKIRHTAMTISVPRNFALAVREYQQWRIDHGLPKASQGVILSTLALQDNKKLWDIYHEKERTDRYGKKYLDAIKTTRAGRGSC